MEKIIKNTLKEFVGQDLTNDDVLETIATKILKDMDESIDPGNITQIMFSRYGLSVLQLVAKELKENKADDKIVELFHKLISACDTYNNGTCVLAFADALIALLKTVQEQNNNAV
jgi:hypothetical protein